ncbi:hypothetical protein ASC97_13620 [Rhizobium sp. Root1203]|nr:hypothetical protein ASC97_13620 [Rhizobium sp. Root1203]
MFRKPHAPDLDVLPLMGMRGAAGLILRPQGNTITSCPSFIIDEAQVDMIADAFEASLSKVEDELRQN